MNSRRTTNAPTASDTAAGALPFTHRLAPGWRLVVCAGSGALAALFGTLVHRSGASSNLPYGLVLALVIIGCSTWCARSRSGAAGLALHLIVSSVVVAVAALGPGGDILIPIGFQARLPFFSQNAGYCWFFGMLLVQIALLMLPARCFSMTSTATQQRRSRADAKTGADVAGRR